MIRRLVPTLAVVVLATLAAVPLQAHPGHEHKVLGTVTMAAADHVMLTDRDGKAVTVYVTKETKVLKDKHVMALADIKVGMRVAITAIVEKVKGQDKATAKVIELGAAPAAK
jgi:hypothetical protein